MEILLSSTFHWTVLLASDKVDINLNLINSICFFYSNTSVRSLCFKKEGKNRHNRLNLTLMEFHHLQLSISDP